MQKRMIFLRESHWKYVRLENPVVAGVGGWPARLELCLVAAGLYISFSGSQYKHDKLVAGFCITCIYINPNLSIHCWGPVSSIFNFKANYVVAFLFTCFRASHKGGSEIYGIAHEQMWL